MTARPEDARLLALSNLTGEKRTVRIPADQAERTLGLKDAASVTDVLSGELGDGHGAQLLRVGDHFEYPLEPYQCALLAVPAALRASTR
jgi:hypothetical protein